MSNNTTNYQSISDMLPIARQLTKYANQAQYDSAEGLLQSFFNDLLQQNPNPDDAIMAFNAVLVGLDDAKDKLSHNNIIGRHSQILRSFCAKQRRDAQAGLTEVDSLAEEHITSANKDALKIAGIRKTIRITKNTGILTPYLKDKEPEYATMAGCSWAAISTWQVIDAGFFCSYGNKFDMQKTLTIIDIQTADNEAGLSFSEFKLMCKILIERCIAEYGEEATVELIRRIATATIEKLPAKSGEQGIEKIKVFASQRLKTNINVSYNDVMKLLPYVLICPDNFLGGCKCPSGSLIQYGLELLYPVAPLLSQEWVSAINKQVSGDFRIGLVDNHALYHALYDCSHNIQTRLLPSASCSYLIGCDHSISEKIAQSSNSSFLASAYTWECSDTGSRNKIYFDLDELLNKNKIFPDKGSFVLKPQAIVPNNKPKIAPYYLMSENTDTSSLGSLDAKNIIAIIDVDAWTSDLKKKELPVWGAALSSAEAQQILPYLDFIPGQEQDARQDIILCKVSPTHTNTVASALFAQKHKKFAFVKTQDTWDE